MVSLFFYFKTSGLLVLLLGSSIIVNYFIGRGLGITSSEIRKKVFVTLSVLFNLITLGYFKYAYFFTESFNEMFHTNYEVFNVFARMANTFMGAGSFADNIVLPVGVSFFTFQSISYVVDIYRKEVGPVKNFFDYAFFVSFFPQLVAGPIVRARDFIPQIRQPFQLNHNDFSWAIIQIVKGILKKVILADYIAIHFIDKVVDAPEAFPGFISILAMWGYSLQIYGDFSGYTDIAIGVSRLLGFKLLENINSPYKAVSVADFWRRWHKSLGSWLRVYLYIPLGGNRGGGIGTYILYSHWKKISPYETSKRWAVRIWRIFLTFNFITFTRIWFRLEKDGAPAEMLGQIWNNFELNQQSISILFDGFDIALLIMLIGYILHWLPGKTKLFWEKVFTRLPLYIQSIVVAIILVFVYQAFSDAFKPFVYFQF